MTTQSPISLTCILASEIESGICIILKLPIRFYSFLEALNPLSATEATPVITCSGKIIRNRTSNRGLR